MKQDRIITILMVLLMFAPFLAFASTGSAGTTDKSFDDMFSQIQGYLNGSFGKLLVIVAFIGAVVAIAGFAPMKVCLPVFGLALSAKFGPEVISSVFGATGGVNSGMPHYSVGLGIFDLIMGMLAVVVFVLGYYKYKISPQNKNSANTQAMVNDNK